MESLLMIAFACAAVSFSIAWTSIFLPIREWVSKLHPRLEELIHCPWCLNHYVAIFFLLITGGDLNIATFIVWWFAIVAIGGVFHYVLLRAYEPVMKASTERHRRKMMKESKE